MAGLCTPLPTLRRCPRGQLRTARGRCGLLYLHRGGLSPPTPCRSPGAPRLRPNTESFFTAAAGEHDHRSSSYLWAKPGMFASVTGPWKSIPFLRCAVIHAGSCFCTGSALGCRLMVFEEERAGPILDARGCPGFNPSTSCKHCGLTQSIVPAGTPLRRESARAKGPYHRPWPCGGDLGRRMGDGERDLAE